MAAAKLRDTHIHVGLYKTDVVLLIGPYEQVHSWLKKNLLKDRYEHIKDAIDNKEKTVQGRTFYLPGGGSVIWLPKRNMPVLVHELFHVVHNMLGARNIELTDDTGEVYAYLLENLYYRLA